MPSLNLLDVNELLRGTVPNPSDRAVARFSSQAITTAVASTPSAHRASHVRRSWVMQISASRIRPCAGMTNHKDGIRQLPLLARTPAPTSTDEPADAFAGRT